MVDLRQARDDWLRRLQTAQHGRSVFDEATIVDYLAAYQRRASPAPATYYRRFGLLRRFLQWLSRRNGLPDWFVELQARPSRNRRPTG
jgi:hypothetical protein